MLLPLVLLLGLAFTLLLHAMTDGGQEGFQVGQEVLLRDTSLPVQEEEQLTLHQIHLGQGEPKSFPSLHGSVPSPVLVLWARVVQVLGGEDQRGQEDAVDSASHALGNGWQTSPEAAQVHQRAHQGGHLDLRPGDERCNEGFDGGKRRQGVGGIHWGCGGRRGLTMLADGVGHMGFASDDL